MLSALERNWYPVTREQKTKRAMYQEIHGAKPGVENVDNSTRFDQKHRN